MRPTRRHILKGAAAAGAVTLLPFTARAAGHGGDVFMAEGGDVVIHPISHASFVMETPAGVIYMDPVGDPGQYDGLPSADLILVTHEHGDHFKADTLAVLKGADTVMITNPAVAGELPDGLKANASQIGNGDSADWNG
ncbi:MAG: MBL fold metallo-hydrolase, partial [Boseongicola sp.]